MNFKDIKHYKTRPNSPEWLERAFSDGIEIGFGSFCCVLASPNEGRVVKLSRKKAESDAHEALAKKSVHFPRAYQRVDDALSYENETLHAIELEHISAFDGLRQNSPQCQLLKPLLDFLYSQKLSKPSFALWEAAEGFDKGAYYSKNLPSTLGVALGELATYAMQTHGFRPTIDLYRENNWGERSDGTYVVLDPLNI
jgi:hypothetical protein